jgi:hypothetical protein
MLAWIGNHAAIISAVTSVGMLIVWVIYLDLFLRSYRLQRKPHLLIKQDGTYRLESHCLISNMSEYAVDVSAVLVDVEWGPYACTLQPMSGSIPEDSASPMTPLQAGSYLQIGTFRDFLDRATEAFRTQGSADMPKVASIEVRLVAFVGAQQIPRGARRRFRVTFGDEVDYLEPIDVVPRQLVSSKHQRMARAWLEEALRLGRNDVPEVRLK